MDNLGEKLAAVLGVSANEQEAADPAKAQEKQILDENQDTGVKEQEPADPAEEKDQEQQKEKQEQTPQQRRENAARRREAERKNAIDEAVARERANTNARLKSLFENAGMKNTFTGEAITTIEELEAFQKQYERDSADKDLEAGKITRKALEQVVEDAIAKQTGTGKNESTGTDPQEQEPEEEEAEEEQPAQQEEMPTQIVDEIREIQKLDKNLAGLNPDQVIQTILQDKKMGPAFTNAVNKEDKSFLEAFKDAYKVANFDAAVASQARGMAEAEARKQRGKAHLTPEGTMRGAGAPTVPARQLAWARKFNPGMTEAEIQAAYTRDQQNLKIT